MSQRPLLRTLPNTADHFATALVLLLLGSGTAAVVIEPTRDGVRVMGLVWACVFLLWFAPGYRIFHREPHYIPQQRIWAYVAGLLLLPASVLSFLLPR